MRRTVIAALLGALSLSAFPCSVFVPGVFPSKLRMVAGEVQGSLSPQQSKLGHRPAIFGAHVELRTRIDQSFVEKVTDESPYRAKMLRRYKGAITAFDCGKLVAGTETDDRGHFELPTPPKGKYCLVITRKEGKDWLISGGRLPIDVSESGARGLVVDLSPSQVNCTGGGVLLHD